MGWILVLLPVFLLLIAGSAYYAYVQQQKRLAEMWRLAESLQWQFQPERDKEHDEEYAYFELFRQGHSRYAYNTLLGSIEVAGAVWPVKMGDFHYQITTSNGKSTSTHTYRFSYVILRLPYVRMPELLVRREGMFDLLKNMFGFDDIDFESAEFSRRFCVTSPVRKFAYDVIHPRMIEFLMAGDPPTIDIESGRCLLSDGKRLWSPAEFRAKLAWVHEFFELWPAHLTNQLNLQP